MKKNTITKTVAAGSLALAVLASGIYAGAAYNVQNRMGPQMFGQQLGQTQNTRMNDMSQFGGQMGGMNQTGGMANQFGGMFGARR